ncbi:MAG: SDR family oxidoreductase [Spirochaetia bacterium]|nr:SDR family oxidoreductase [Spirochaetia bacterium]
MNEKAIKELAAIIRGYFFDSESSIVVHTTTLDAGDLILKESVLTLEHKDQSLYVQESIDTYSKKHTSYPTSISIENSSLGYILGNTFEEAIHRKPFNRKVGYKGSSQRSDIMKGKISCVTGGAQGFGAGIVRGLIEEGGFVYIADMNEKGAIEFATLLNEEYKSTVAFPLYVDVSKEESVEQMIDTIASTTGGFDLFVSNAGVLKAGSVKEMSLRDFEFVTQVDYTGFFICTKFASRLLALQNLGSKGLYMSDIITISSKSGLEGSNKNGAYAGAKFGTIGLTQSFALELISDNIKVNAVCPGNFLDGPLWSDPEKGLFVQYLHANKVPGAKTIEDVRKFYESKVPISRGCRTEDVLRAICYIVEQKYETGQAVPVTGGQVMLN